MVSRNPSAKARPRPQRTRTGGDKSPLTRTRVGQKALPVPRRSTQPFLPRLWGQILWGIQLLLGRKPLSVRGMALRTLLAGGALMLGLLGLGIRLVDLQVTQAPELSRRAQSQQQALLRPFIPRRSIVDRHSVANQQAELLAVDRPAYTLWAHPSLFGDRRPQEIAAALAPILKRTEADILNRFTTGGRTGIRLERWVPVEVADQIQALYMDGLELVSERQRVYPQREVAAEVVGYVDLDHIGQAGLEYSQQGLLERTVQPMIIPRDGYGRLLAAEVPETLMQQSSETVLQLTLDMRLQRAARTALQAQIQQFGAIRGTAIVLQPRTGEILALVSEPTYDPNRYYDGYDPALFRNWAVTDLYEPGSTFKPLNIAIGLDVGAFRPDATLYDEGRVIIGGWPVQNHDYDQRGAPGWLSVTDIMKQSSNVGMVRLMERIPPRQYFERLMGLGLGQPTGVDLPFEPASRLKPQAQFERVAIERATTAFGQGFSLTPLGLATLHAIIANGGYSVTPHVVRGLVERDTDQLVWQPSRPERRTLLSEASTRAVRSQMRDVVDYGTGRNAHIEGYEIGGKTGTAQKANPRGGGYLAGKRITSFVGYFPAMEPDYVLLAVVDEPRGDDAYGSSVTAPIVRAILQEIITLEGIPPRVS